MTTTVTPLEPWMKRKITGDCSGLLSRKQIEDYQLVKIQETLDLVLSKSRFYQRLYSGLDCNISSLQDLTRLPFTTALDVQQSSMDFLCVSQDAIDRIVSLQSSGTSGKPKRVFFTREDQELTIDFFHHGMLNLVTPGDRVLILLPGQTPGSVGDLLRLGLERAGVKGIVHGPVSNPEITIEQIHRDKINVLVGIPTQVLALARRKGADGCPFTLQLKSVLLSTDHVPKAIVRELENSWGCLVFNHYGMTEMGLGGGVECLGFSGYHLREADMYMEIINPSSGKPVLPGELGEVVFTTLTRNGMPLIRYRTGDISRFLPEACSCGTVLRRLDRMKSRDRVYLSEGKLLTMADFDEALFSLDNVLDFSLTITDVQETCLKLHVQLAEPVPPGIEQLVLQALDEISTLGDAIKNCMLKVIIDFSSDLQLAFRNGTAKRQIQDMRGRT